jgi:hypothetical protein
MLRSFEPCAKRITPRVSSTTQGDGTNGHEPAGSSSALEETGNVMPKSNNAAQNNRANQMNPNNAAYQGSRSGSGHSKAALDNRSVQLNPNHGGGSACHQSTSPSVCPKPSEPSK